MSRSKAFAVGHDRPPAEITSPTELRRLRDAALSDVRSADWGSEIGRLHLTNRLNSAELSTAKRWFELVNAYSIAYRSPTQPRSVLFDVGGGQPSDPTSEEAGLREAKKHERTVADWIQDRDALRKAGKSSSTATRSTSMACGFGSTRRRYSSRAARTS